MQEIIPFEYEGRNVRVITDDAGEPWWVAADVCKVLGLDNPTKALLRLDDDEKSQVIDPATLNNIQGAQINNLLNIINEYGLYSLILTSRKPEAKAFKRWVTHEVLPTLRKTGSYSMPTTAAPTKRQRKKPVPLADQTSPLDEFLPRPYFKVIAGYQSALKGQKKLGKDALQASIAAAQITAQAFGVDVDRYLMLDLPKAAPTPTVVENAACPVDSEPVYRSARDLAALIPVTCSTGQPDAKKVNDALVKLGYARRRDDNVVYPREPAAEGLFQMRPVISENGQPINGKYFTVWDTDKILPILRRHFSRQTRQLQLIQ
ncbi:hypothetical protein HFQ13_10685 [Acidithiobacillus sp. VAN18-1]|uniref:Bro-N domain-containing protein n=1 Tax=Igneacidithiobacillus copahuensis TaxID=2724909 RepID=A0AAE2YQT0_9PROT|nr:BRO family protein [Igneacidithiobacillus copahuensis]MBU2788657.1 hypothetical protein [Igneacidithiobacillus copahuensis]MBU2796659.1 hypothetical protein [Acidithiobacillus sp. VAN18-2]